MPALEKNQTSPVYADLLSVMTPDDGWHVDVAVLASYSLDFTALGLMLMSMAGVWEQDGKPPSKTDFARAVDAMRGKVTVIIHPTRAKPFRSGGTKYLHLMDQFVTEYKYQGEKTEKHSWHPKFALVRLSPEKSSKGKPNSQWRFWFGSKNFTRIDNLDIGMTLVSGFGNNCVVVPGIEQLAKKASRHLPSPMAESLGQYSDELAKCRWKLPTGVKSLSLDLLLPDEDRHYPKFSKNLRELFILSPFLDSRTIKELSKHGQSREQRLLISSERELRKAPKLLPEFKTFHFPNVFERNSLDESEEDPEASSQTISDEQDDILNDLVSGLHAKVIMTKSANKNRVLLGSVNATHRGWHRNVEVLGDCEVNKTVYDRLKNIIEQHREIYLYDGSEEPEVEDETSDVEQVRRGIEDILVHESIHVSYIRRQSVADIHVPRSILKESADVKLYFDWANGKNPVLIEKPRFNAELLDESAMSDMVRLIIEADEDRVCITTKAVFDKFDTKARDHAAFSRYLTANSFLELVFQDLTGVKRSAEGSHWDDETFLNMEKSKVDAKTASYWLDRMPTVDMIFRSWAIDPTVMQRVAEHLKTAEKLAMRDDSKWSDADKERVSQFAKVFGEIALGLKDYS